MGNKKTPIDSAYVLVFFNHKGGVGKTTNTLTVADALAREKYRVLLIDLDPQHNSSSLLVPVDVNERKTARQFLTNRKTVIDLLLEPESRAEAVLQEAIIPETTVPGVSLLPSNLQLATAENYLRASPVASPLGYLRRRIRSLLKQYDFILIDVSPTLTTLPGNALAAATHLVVPFRGGDYYGLEGFDDLERYVREIKENEINPGLELLGAVINGHDRRESAHQAMEERIAERLPVLATVPRQASVEKAAIMGRTILGFERSSTAARAYVEFARSLLTSLGLRGGAK